MKYILMTITVLTIVLTGSIVLASTKPDNKRVFDSELNKIRYNYAYAVSLSDGDGLDFDDPVAASGESFKNTGEKSAAKAFLLSLAVPGLGQYYYGSKIKPIAFLGIEATAWILNVNWHGKGEDLTAEFEQFNRDHWIQSNYEDYLETIYGARDDEDIPAQELSHNLPDTRTQQYYEMTGKYDQFSWGWDDAVLNGMTHADFDSSSSSPFPPAITTSAAVPYSSRRLTYETMRNEANIKLNDANKMVMVILANHLVSAIEAYISTNRLNSKSEKSGEFSNLKLRPTIRSYNYRSDTPYLNMTYKF